MTREEAINMLHGIRADNLNLDDAYTKDKYEALEMAIKALEQETKTGYLSIDDAMSVFDDFMCGEVDEDSMEIFLEMLKDKAESEG